MRSRFTLLLLASFATMASTASATSPFSAGLRSPSAISTPSKTAAAATHASTHDSSHASPSAQSTHATGATVAARPAGNVRVGYGRLSAAKVAPKTTAQKPAEHEETYTQEGTQSLGSNGGRWYKDSKGNDWFGKPGKGDAHEMDRLGNEHAINQIYGIAHEAFGTKAPELRSATVNGKKFLMSRKMGLSNATSFTPEQLKQFGEGFVIDAWVANWDIGMAHQLVSSSSGEMLRIDAGGGGLFRARGDLRGAQLGDKVGELETMRSPNFPSSFAFRGVTDHDLKIQLKKFAAWYPKNKDKVEAAIDRTTMSPAAAQELKTKLDARAKHLISESEKE